VYIDVGNVRNVISEARIGTEGGHTGGVRNVRSV
jgi:hypothetical protein